MAMIFFVGTIIAQINTHLDMIYLSDGSVHFCTITQIREHNNKEIYVYYKKDKSTDELCNINLIDSIYISQSSRTISSYQLKYDLKSQSTINQNKSDIINIQNSLNQFHQRYREGTITLSTGFMVSIIGVLP